jgi:probable phosphoglycerate mutase
VDLYLIRHGEAEPIVEEGDLPADPPLTETGRRQAERLAVWLAGEGLDEVVSSPLRRARETAAPLGRATGLDVEILDELAEYDRGSLTYLPPHMLPKDDPEWRHMIETGMYLPKEGGEDPVLFRRRSVATVEAVIERFPGRKVAVVCHGGVINAYLAHLLGIARLFFFDPANTGISRVAAARGGERSIVSVNETGHLVGRRQARGPGMSNEPPATSG